MLESKLIEKKLRAKLVTVLYFLLENRQKQPDIAIKNAFIFNLTSHAPPRFLSGTTYRPSLR